MDSSTNLRRFWIDVMAIDMFPTWERSHFLRWLAVLSGVLRWRRNCRELCLSCLLFPSLSACSIPGMATTASTDALRRSLLSSCLLARLGIYDRFYVRQRREGLLPAQACDATVDMRFAGSNFPFSVIRAFWPQLYLQPAAGTPNGSHITRLGLSTWIL